MHEIGVREVVEFMGFTLNWGTLIMTWLTMGIVLLIALLATRKITTVPKGAQNVVEIIIEMLHAQMDAVMGKNGRFLAPVIVTLFMFILVSNWLGLIPKMESPTNDLNTTIGLALCVTLIVHLAGLYVHGAHHLKHFFQPFAPFVVLNLVEEVARPATLAFRLFGNILAGEILIIILLQLMPWWFPIPSVIWLAFSIFVGMVQAFVFTMLSITYIAGGVR